MQEVQDTAIQSYVAAVESAETGMTLWQIMGSGGWVMIALAVMSLIMIALVVYLFLRLQPSQLIPVPLSEKLIDQVRKGKDIAARKMCADHENIVSEMIIAGLNQAEKGMRASREAVELSARKQVSGLWAILNYLSDIAAIAPMLGLLGTVIGMIEAFNTIAFQTAVVKPVLLAGGVSKAMVTTASGMIVAIIAMVFYSVFRFRLQNITHAVETFTSEILDAFSGPAGSR